MIKTIRICSKCGRQDEIGLDLPPRNSFITKLGPKDFCDKHTKEYEELLGKMEEENTKLLGKWLRNE